MTDHERPAQPLPHPHGPHSDATTMDTARLFAETLRVLNYATGPHAATGLTELVTAYAVCAELAAATNRLGEIATQLAAFLDRELAGGRLDCPGDYSAAQAVDYARQSASRARKAAAELAASFGALQTAGFARLRPAAERDGDA